jgi:cephalosporin-C deacetylase-like acetyl esterase/multidrug transporter EmrE-like cation transporter
VGAGLALVALPMLAAGRTNGPARHAAWFGSLLIGALFVMNGACGAVGKWYHVVGRPVERPVFFGVLYAVAAAYAASVWLVRSRRACGEELAIGIGLGVINAAANFTLLAALDHLSGVVVFPVTAAGGLVLAVLFSAVVWKEWPNRWGLAGVVLAVVAVTAVNLTPTNGKLTSGLLPPPFGDRSAPTWPRSEGPQEPQGTMAEPQDLHALWDLDAIAAEPLRLQVVKEGATGWGAMRVRTRELRYFSHRWTEGDVVIAGHLALPAARGPVPAMVLGTGDAEQGIDFARKHGVATLVIDRPGTGESTGPEDDYHNWVHFSDPRESWMWHYITAALRAVTLLRALPEVEADRIGVTGSSRGGTMAWIAGAVDPRLGLSVPVATGGDIVRALDHGGWANYLHRDEQGQAFIPKEFHSFARYYDPMLYAAGHQAAVLLIIGAQDEYFPLYCTKTGAEAWAGEDFRVLILANWDHGYFSGDNPEVEAFDNREEVGRKRDLAVGAAIEAWLRGGTMPKAPTLDVTPEGEALACSIGVDPARPAKSVVIHVSFDGAHTFQEVAAGEGFAARVAGPDTARLQQVALYAEVEYAGGPVLTSLPWFGPAFEQRMRPFPEP